METKIIPFGNNILVEPQEHDTILKAATGSLCEYGKILAVGPDVKELKVGEIIGYTVFGINSLEINGKKHYFVPETAEFVLGRIEMSWSVAPQV